MIFWFEFYGLREFLTGFNKQFGRAKLTVSTKYLHGFVVVFLSKRLVALSFQSIGHDDLGDEVEV